MAEVEEAVAANSAAATVASPSLAAEAEAAGLGLESESESSPVAASSSGNMRKSSLGSVVLYVPLPIQKVWDIVSDLFGERYGWPTQVSITPLTLNGVSVGARRRVADKADPQQTWVIERLVAVEPQEYWYTYTVDECPEPGIIGSSGLMQLFSEKSLAEGEEEKTRVVWSYALLPQEGEQFVPRTRMEQVRQTLVAYLMGIGDLDHGRLADDSSSDESDSEDDEPPPAQWHTQALHTQKGLLVDVPTQQQPQQEEANQSSTHQQEQEEANHSSTRQQEEANHSSTRHQEEENPTHKQEEATQSSTQQLEEESPTPQQQEEATQSPPQQQQQQEGESPTQQQEEVTQSPTQQQQQQQEAAHSPTQQQQQEATQPPTQTQQQEQEATQPPTQPQQEDAPQRPTQPQQEEGPQPPPQPHQEATQTPIQPQEATPTHQQASPTQQQEAAPHKNNETESANQNPAAFQLASRPKAHPPPIEDDSGRPVRAEEEQDNPQGNTQNESQPGNAQVVEGMGDEVKPEDAQ